MAESTTGRPCFSFEFFPPKADTGFAQLRETLATLRELQPSFVSVTYGAGGTTRLRTLDLVTNIKRDYGLEAMAHLTCVGASRGEILQVLEQLRDGSPSPAAAL